MRLFIGAMMPQEVQEKIRHLQKEIERKKLFTQDSGTQPRDAHLTLKFLGEVSEERAEEIKKKLGEIKELKVHSKVERVGAFDKDHIKIVWIKTPGFEILQEAIDEKLKELGISEEKRFMGHVTIARVKEYQRGKEEEIIRELVTMKAGEEFQVKEYCLIKSVLKPSGPEYKILEKYKLG